MLYIWLILQIAEHFVSRSADKSEMVMFKVKVLQVDDMLCYIIPY